MLYSVLNMVVKKQLSSVTQNDIKAGAYIYCLGDWLRIESIRPDYWVATGKGINRKSWSCHGGTEASVIEKITPPILA